MTKLLVTASQGYYSHKGIFIVDTETRTYEKVFGISDPNASYNDMRCYLGLAQFKDGYILNTRRDGIVIFDKDFKITENRFNVGRNLHDVIVVDDYYYVVETKDDTVSIFSIETGQLISKKYYGTNLESKDQLHLNSLRYHNGKFYLSSFWTRETTKVRQNGQGAIARLNNKLEIEEYIVTGLHRPHSLLFAKDEMYYIESEKQRLCKYPHEIVTNLQGFPRGLAFDGELFYIGESYNRTFLKSEQLEFCGAHSNLVIYDPNKKTQIRIVLPCVEIYEVLIMK